MMRPVAETGRLLEINQISHGTWDVTIQAPKIANSCRAGQFVHVRVGDVFNPFLRRPLSIGPCEGDNLRLIFTERGRGTELLAQKQPGDVVDLIGPLGNAYPLPAEDVHLGLIAGGIGVVPLLLFDSQTGNETERSFLLGVRSKDFLTVTESEIKAHGLFVSSDDGSIGYKGNVVELLEKRLSSIRNKKIVVYACGPGVMMRALKGFCAEHGFPLYVSLEVSMGCGVGACQSCAVDNAENDGYLLVCKDGPVFRAQDVDLSPERLP